MTEEEALQQYMQLMQMQSDPTMAAFNDYGAGSDYLDFAKKPKSFARQGDMHQIYRNMLGMTGIKLPELVPGMYPEVPKPEGQQPYQSDTVALYQKNPAYAAVLKLVDNGAPFEAALQSVTTEPELAKYVPVDNAGKLDLGGFRTSAATYITEGQKAASENAAFDAEQAAYDDYVRTRTGWDAAPGQTDLSGLMRETNPLKVPAAADTRGRPESLKQLVDARSRIDSATTSLPPAKVRANIRVTQDQGVKNQVSSNKAYNDAVLKGYSGVKGRKERILLPSKEQENQQKLIAFYNQMIRQGG